MANANTAIQGSTSGVHVFVPFRHSFLQITSLANGGKVHGPSHEHLSQTCFLVFSVASPTTAATDLEKARKNVWGQGYTCIALLNGKQMRTKLIGQWIRTSLGDASKAQHAFHYRSKRDSMGLRGQHTGIGHLI